METADDACRTGKAMLGALMERKAQRGTNRACSGMVATEHCQAQDKGFIGVRNTLKGREGWKFNTFFLSLVHKR